MKFLWPAIDKHMGEKMPRWYGVAYYTEHIGVCYPVPLNLLVGLIRKLWYWMVRGISPSKIDKQISHAYQEGMLEGYKQGTKSRHNRTLEEKRDI
ncbi:MAG TPA: hypothetical protein ENH85_12375 [Candidatus Scalindua sp.]|nr:hypothetical protein [Candidatus Scalindua sp.]